MTPHFTLEQTQELSTLFTQDYINWSEVRKFVPLSRFEKWRSPDTSSILQRITVSVNEIFVKMEQKGVKVFTEEYRDTFDMYLRKINLRISLARQIFEHATQLSYQSPQLKKELLKLQCHLVGLQYRLGAVNPDCVPLCEDRDFKDYLVREAQEWKNKNDLLHDKSLNLLEILQLKEAACYPSWRLAFEKDEEYRLEFFNWALRDHNPVNVFILCPNAKDRIKEAYLEKIAGRIRKANEEVLQFRKIETKTRGIERIVLTLPIYEGSCEAPFDPQLRKYVNISDPSTKVHFFEDSDKQFTMSIAELFKDQANKNAVEPTTTLTYPGLILWRSGNGIWNTQTNKYMPLDTSSTTKWIDHVPAADILSDTQVRRRYGDSVAATSMIVHVAATRKFKSLYAFDCHGFATIYKKLNEREWKVIDIGAYPHYFPMTLWEKLKYLCSTVRRVITEIDQNGSYSQRSTVLVPFLLTPDQEQTFLKEMHQEFFSGPTFFQFTGENCSKPIQEIITKVVGEETPNFFRIPMYKVRSGVRLIDGYLRFIEKIPLWIPYRERIQAIGLKILQNLFGSWRSFTLGRKSYSVNQYYHENPQMEMDHPASLFDRVLAAQQMVQHQQRTYEDWILAKGRITWGNTEPKLADVNEWEAYKVALKA